MFNQIIIIQESMPEFILTFLFIIGACLGSFANVIIYRMPKNESILGRSRCSQCHNPVKWFLNIPIFSYFILRGRCSNCKASFSIRYPFVELLMASLFSGIYYYYGMTWLTLEYLVMTFGLVTCSFIDIDHYILPDEFTLGGCVLGLVGAALNPEREFLQGLFGFLFGGGSLWLVAWVYFVFTGREGMGGGDIKLLAWLGAILGWKAIPLVILSSCIVGVFASLFLARKSENIRHYAIPFGPFLIFGAFLYIFALKTMGDIYVNLFFIDLGV